ncbi:putative carboxyvinyl-carboxyphosphonate phosphorylmutase [Labilithrix luteola]|uniref:Putative carboxyvinyl-carboxyphosphonate phosphorylmutase n=1 Tax=Labilithrix luteola TaxID=1391654 RepID=A0A0K1QB75_9BACT|nr:isocitrate lyase/phosphoenolpyruvate mutase family protein [Labilithrix luteola]AKV02994.1 putative carboxyvinyl-carboxyphosphonate phosphorylmutase [Labilithrix luteola]
MTFEARAARFRALHDGPGALVLPNAWDALSARIAESCGAAAVATTSAALAWSQGCADGEALAFDTLVDRARAIVEAVDVPVTVDFERGWSSDPEEVAANVARLAAIGVVGVNLEDGSEGPELLARKVAACKARAPHVFVNARTDVVLRGLAPAERMVEEVLARARVYEAAGADGFFVPRITANEAIAAITSGTRLPVNVMVIQGLAPVSELATLGVRRVSAGPRIAEAAFSAARRACKELLERGTYTEVLSADLAYPAIQALFTTR